jgi:hypothetical protein
MDKYSIETMHDIKQISIINHAHLGQGRISFSKVEISEITVWIYYLKSEYLVILAEA